MTAIARRRRAGRTQRPVAAATTKAMVDGAARVTVSVWPVWAAGWLGLAGLGVANGAARDMLYADRVGEQTAHRLSTGTLVAAFVPALWALDRARPLPSERVALEVGTALAGLTVGFEVVFGTVVRPEPLSLREILADYDVTAGRLWVAVPLTLLVGPALVRRRRLTRTTTGSELV